MAASVVLIIPGQASASARDFSEVRAVAFERLERAADLVSTGRLTDAIAAAAGVADVELPNGIPAVNETSPAPGLPVELGSVVSRLTEAVAVAGDLVTAATPAHFDFRDQGVDRETLAAAGLVLAGTIDASLPAFQSYAATAPTTTSSVGCDQLEQGPVCVGGNGANTYENDYALLIDLGGDDTHANSAGGADRAANGLAVSVTIDLGGNDRYATALPTKSGSRVAQGSASQGIGILVDSAGADSYEVTSTQPTIHARAQGFAGAGLGILDDHAGNDSYSISYTPSSNPASRVQGQGFSSFGLAGLLLDRGGNDTYVAKSETPVTVDDSGRVNPGAPLVQAMGYGEAGGAGILADSGGSDTMTMSAHSAPVSAEEKREVVAGAANVEGFGFGTLGGAGLALSGPGNTSWAISTRAEAPAVRGSSVYGFGYGSTGGYGALQDAGGDDSYVADAEAIAVRRHRVDDACSCNGASASVEAANASIRAGGWGGAGIGILQDLGGADRYVMSAVTRVEAYAEDARTQAPSSAMAFAGGGLGDVNALGHGSVGGAGFVDDQGGNDVYDVQSASHATASATGASPGPGLSAFAEPGRAVTWAQGFGSTGGYGELRDGGGTDQYRAGADASAVMDPANDTGAVPERQISVQGSVEVQPINGAAHPAGGIALLLDTDGGAADVFTASPADPACTGTRGQGVWRDCGPIAGLGMAV